MGNNNLERNPKSELKKFSRLCTFKAKKHLGKKSKVFCKCKSNFSRIANLDPLTLMNGDPDLKTCHLPEWPSERNFKDGSN